MAGSVSGHQYFAEELTRPCIIIMERDTRDCWSMEGRPIWAIRFTATMWKRGSFTPCFSGSQGIRRIRRSNTSREATAQRPWAISVAHATPATPMPNRMTNSRSSTMFVRLEIIRKTGASCCPLGVIDAVESVVEEQEDRAAEIDLQIPSGSRP